MRGTLEALNGRGHMDIPTRDQSDHLLCDFYCWGFSFNTYTGDLNWWKLLRLDSILVPVNLNIGNML